MITLLLYSETDAQTEVTGTYLWDQTESIVPTLVSLSTHLSFQECSYHFKVLRIFNVPRIEREIDLTRVLHDEQKCA